MNDSLTYLLCTTSRLVTRLVDAAVASKGITPQQVMMLDVINRASGEHLNAISVMLKMDRTTFTRNVGVLVVNGWVVCGKGRDARCKTYTLTPSGLNLLKITGKLIEAAENDLLMKVGGDLFDQVTVALESLSKRLAW